MANPYSKKFTAQKTFTDRDDFKEILKASVEEKQRFDEYRIKVFYGVGGQGKSFLKNIFFVSEYLKPAIQKNKNLIYCDTIDFEKDESKRQPDEALLSIAKTLIEKGNIPLPAFTLGMLKYKNLSSVALNFEQTYPYLFRLSGKIASNNFTNEILNEVLSFGAEALTSGIPVLGFFIKKMANSGKSKIIEWIRKSDASEILADLDDLDKFSLIERLPKLLAYDVFKSLENDYDEKGMQEKRIVIIIDGYETLWQNEKNENINKDEWLRTLVRFMPGVLFIIFGRDKLRWAEIEKDEEFNSSIDQHLITGLSDIDADSYLSSVPIEDPEIRNAIIRNSKGMNSMDGCLPLYLDLEVNTYELIINKARNPTAKDFEQAGEKTGLEIVHRFFRHVRLDLSNSIEALSLSNYFDAEIIKLMENLAFSPGIISMSTMSEYSFIHFANNRATIHSLVREVAAAQYKKKHPEKYFEIHRALFNYFDNQLSSTELTEITPPIETILSNAGVHKEIYDQLNFPHWLVEKSKNLYGNGYYNTFYNFVLHAIELLKSKTAPIPDEEILMGKLYFILANNDEYRRDYVNAEKNIEAASTIYEKKFPEDFWKMYEQNQEEILSPIELKEVEDYKIALELGGSIKLSMGKTIQSGGMYRNAKDIANRFSLNFDQYGYAKYLSRTGNVFAAEQFFFDLWKLSVSSNDTHSSAFYAYDLANILSIQDRFEEAVFYHKFCVDACIKLNGEDHVNTGVAMNNFASTLIREDSDLKKAEQFINDASDIFSKNFPDDHLNFGMLYRNMFYISLNKDISKALHYFNKAKKIFDLRSGERNKESIEMLIDLCWHLSSNNFDVEDEYKLQLEDYFGKDFLYTKQILNFYNVSLYKGLQLMKNHLEELGFDDHENLYSAKFKELNRLLKEHTLPRTGMHDPIVIEIVFPEKETLLSGFREHTSLPENINSVKVGKINLTFLKKHNLYLLILLNDKNPFCKYFFNDSENSILIDGWIKPLNMIKDDLNLTFETILGYTVFIFDFMYQNRHGNKVQLLDEKNIPWRIDIDVEENLKSAIREKITPLKLISENDDEFILEGYFLFMDVIDLCKINVNKKDGYIYMMESKRLRLFFNKDTFVCTFNLEKENIDDIENFQEIYSMQCYSVSVHLNAGEFERLYQRFLLELEDEDYEFLCYFTDEATPETIAQMINIPVDEVLQKREVLSNQLLFKISMIMPF